MSKMAIDVGTEFYHRLVNRDERQGDGTHTGTEFRKRYLSELDSQVWWDKSEQVIELNFSGVRTLGPSWANEVFAYFTRYASPDDILERIRLGNISEVKLRIIKNELDSGHSTK
jgi:hypothetical protein